MLPERANNTFLTLEREKSVIDEVVVLSEVFYWERFMDLRREELPGHLLVDVYCYKRLYLRDWKAFCSSFLRWDADAFCYCFLVHQELLVLVARNCTCHCCS